MPVWQVSWLSQGRPPETQSRRFRSADDTTRIIKPYTKLKMYTDRSFSVAGLYEWNLLPRSLREIRSYDTFKKQLKTHVFKQYFKLSKMNFSMEKML